MGMFRPRIAIAIAGAQKAGTTSLLRYLSQHPQLSGHIPDEYAYFADEDEWRKGWDAAYERYYYGATTDLLVAKSARLYANSLDIERLAAHNPACTIALVLRDPVDRAFSAYRMGINRGWLSGPFEEIVNALDDKTHDWNRLLIEYGNYSAALRRIYEHFPPSQVKVFIYEQFIMDPTQPCRDIFTSLGIDASFCPNTAVAHNVQREPISHAAGSALNWLRRYHNPVKRMAKRALPTQAFDRIAHTLVQANQGAPIADQRMPEDVRSALARFYHSSNRELERQLGVHLSHWAGMKEATLGEPSRSQGPRRHLDGSQSQGVL
jgi:hypothetical protein